MLLSERRTKSIPLLEPDLHGKIAIAYSISQTAIDSHGWLIINPQLDGGIGVDVIVESEFRGICWLLRRSKSATLNISVSWTKKARNG